MEITITKNYKEMSKVSARIIAEEIRKKHNLVLGLATGDTPIGTYKELVRIHKEEGLDFSKVKSFNLDEYLGLAPLHKNSYNYFIITYSMFYKLIKIGNATGVTIPKKLLSLLDMEKGEEVLIKPDLKNKSIVIKSIAVAKDEVNKDVVEGTKKFIKKYPKALKNLAK